MRRPFKHFGLRLSPVYGFFDTPLDNHPKGASVTAVQRNNVQVRGHGDTAMVFAHGFGCDQNMWRFVAPAFEDRYRTVLFDNVGAGGSDLSAYNYGKYASL